jgi:hypothetical protein
MAEVAMELRIKADVALHLRIKAYKRAKQIMVSSFVVCWIEPIPSPS